MHLLSLNDYIRSSIDYYSHCSVLLMVCVVLYCCDWWS